MTGVGTVLTAEMGREAIEAGAEFVVSPAFVPGLAEICADANAPLALGAATPTEALRAHEAGADFIKVFPAAQLGGPGFIKALKSVYPSFDIMPTGGVNPPDIAAYLSAGASWPRHGRRAGWTRRRCREATMRQSAPPPLRFSPFSRLCRDQT